MLVVLDRLGRIVRFNQACVRITGYAVAEVLGKLFWDLFFVPGEAELVKKVFRQLRPDQCHPEYKNYWVAKDGRRRLISWSNTVLQGEDREVEYVIITGQDITTRRLAEDTFEVLINSAPIGIFIVQDGNFRMLNPGFLKICGYSHEELINRDSLQRVAAGFREDLRRNAIRMLKGESLTPYEFPIVTKSGETKWLMETITSTIYQGRRAAMGFFLEISDRKRLEDQFLQAQKMEAVGRLAGGVAHDFNNMLGVILGYTEVALMELDEQDQIHKNLEEVRSAAQRAVGLVRQLLAFARKRVATPQMIDLNDTVSGLLKMLRRLIGEDIILAWLPGQDLWNVRIDPSQIDQLLANLIVNARDAIAGVGKVEIETVNLGFDEAHCDNHAGCLPGEYVMLAVSDNGCGMDQETLANIFEPFFTTKEPGKGTGLGLSTVYGIIKQNQGFISVYSEPSQGTTFKIYLPRFQAAAAEASTKMERAAPQRGKETVLVVEDEEMLLNLNKVFLECLGYKVLAAQAPTEAIRLAREHAGEIDLLITDVVLPEMNGWELAKRLRSIKPLMKCLYMSGYAADLIAHRGLQTKGVSFIPKPFSIKELADKAREALEQESTLMEMEI